MIKKRQGSDLFIVDNSDELWKARQYLHDWCEIAKSIDIATGCFEIGSLLSLDGQWQKLQKIRILMGDEVTKRTKQAFVAALTNVGKTLNDSLESEKETNDFLDGVPAIVKALATGMIECRVYRKRKFHAKAYITHAKLDVVGPAALVGSSNFTRPGLTENVELNIQVRREVNLLQHWFDEHWKEAEDVTPDILKTIERHIREYSPFEVYAKSLQEFFSGHEMTASEWEKSESKMFQVLDQYQRDAYRAMMKIARQYGGAFLCDGVGLGKTYVGLMLIERLVTQERKRVALLVPKAARKDVWERDLKRYLPKLFGRVYGTGVAIYSHTDLGRGGEFPDRFQEIKEMTDVILIDEAHHFRNPGIKGTGEGRIKGEKKRKPSRYRLLFDLIEGARGAKQVFMLTATPINNRLDDFRHMTELFSRQREDYFKSTLGINSLRGHFVGMEQELRRAMEASEEATGRATDLAEAERVLFEDSLFRSIVVQRSRSYVKKSQMQQGAAVTMFPKREEPAVADYSVKKTYGRLLDMVEKAFDKKTPLFVLGIYYPLAYYEGPDEEVDPFVENRQKQVVALIRTQFLKRFESSARAFEKSCDRLLLKLLAWVEKQSKTDRQMAKLERWKVRHAELTGYVQRTYQAELFPDEKREEADEDFEMQELVDKVEELSPDEYDIDAILSDSYEDLDTLAEFLNELRKFEPRHDDKVKALKRLLKTDPVLKKHKVVIFTEFADTARYLLAQLKEAGIEGVEEIDSGRKCDRSDILKRFSPYYNNSSSDQLGQEHKKEIRVMISTDVLSEGLNLQDATRLINYDLHWNPVRLMQRIGRVDRRLDPEIEARIVADHPDQKELRAKVKYWNFLPPDELNDLLRLYERVAHKTLRISKTFGIEGKKLLTPQDDFDALREFNEKYEGTTTPVEEMLLTYQEMLAEYPELEENLNQMPLRVFSGKKHPTKDARALFLCYDLPIPNAKGEWDSEQSTSGWYLFDLETGKVLEDAQAINESIKCTERTPRRLKEDKKTLVDARKAVEKHIHNTYMKRIQAPTTGNDANRARPILKAWMELS